MNDIFDRKSDLLLERFRQLSPSGRMSKKEELDGALIYLASSANSSVIDQNIIIDGGWTSRTLRYSGKNYCIMPLNQQKTKQME